MKTNEINLKVPAEFDRKRLDVFIARLSPNHSRSFFQRLIKAGAVTVNGMVCELPRSAVRQDDVVRVVWPDDEVPELKAEQIDLQVLYEDSDLLVINKPPGMVVHPSAGHRDGTVVNALLGRDPDFIGDLPQTSGRPGIVHRLDKDTSGCLVIAKNSSTLFKLSHAFSERQVKKCYVTLVWGQPRSATGRIVNLIGRHPVNRQKMAVVERNGKEAVTEYELLRQGNIAGRPASLLAVRIMTGRTHQIRVHMASLNLPVISDAIYGRKNDHTAPRQMLHAWKLSFQHPTSGDLLQFEAPWPDDFMALAELLEPVG